MIVDWSKRRNINTAALVTIVQCNTLVLLCFRQFTGPADWVLSHWDLNAVISLEFILYHSGVVLVGLKPISVANWLLSVL